MTDQVNAAHAISLWITYAPLYRLSLNCYERGYEVGALDDDRGCWVPIACGKDLVETMIAACGRAREMKPLGPIMECTEDA